MNAEVFAKGLENYRLLTSFPEQNVENFDDYDCPKFQDLVGERTTENLWICCS